MNGWSYLALAIFFEVAGTTAMKISDGFSKFWPSVAMLVFYLLSLSALTFSLKKIELSVAYAVWGGVGTALVAIVGFVWFHEYVTTLKIVSLILVVSGVIGLHMSSTS